MAGYKREVRPGIWRLEYQYEGEKYSKNIKANSPSEASRLLALFVSEVERGNYYKNQSITFVEFAQIFIDKYAKPNLSPTTVRDYMSRLNKYILSDFGAMKLHSIKRLHIQEFANKLVEEYNLSSKTTKNNIKLISSILNKAVEWDYIQNNVADKVTIPKNLNKEKKKIVLYSYDELNLLINKLEKLDNIELKVAIYTSLYTGARRGEVMALTFNDIDFNKKTIDLNRNKVTVVGGTQLKDIKTGKSRLFYIPDNYINIVKEYYNYLGKPDKKTFLFNMHPDTYSREFKKFLSDNNLRNINLKDLRALNESILVNQGLDVVSVAKRLGHLPSTAANYYLSEIPEEDKKASEILQNLF